jgi:hypothetical protein
MVYNYIHRDDVDTAWSFPEMGGAKALMMPSLRAETIPFDQ